MEVINLFSLTTTHFRRNRHVVNEISEVVPSTIQISSYKRDIFQLNPKRPGGNLQIVEYERPVHLASMTPEGRVPQFLALLHAAQITQINYSCHPPLPSASCHTRINDI